jgi:hypothetical protein
MTFVISYNFWKSKPSSPSPSGFFTNLGRAIDARLHTATSSGEV